MSYYRHSPYRPGGGLSFGVPALTPVTRALMIACVGVWLVQFVVDRTVPPETLDLARLFGLVPRDVALRGWVWQPFTYMFLHSPRQIMHLVLNMLVLWMVGGDLERHWGGSRFLTYYLVSGAGAGVFVTIAGMLTGSTAPTIGASGAIYGLLLAYGMTFSQRVILFMLVFPMRARTLSIILFVIAFVSALGQGGGPVSHIAHLGGMVVGWMYLKRVWRIHDLWNEVRWRWRRRRFRVEPRDDSDRWVN